MQMFSICSRISQLRERHWRVILLTEPIEHHTVSRDQLDKLGQNFDIEL